MALPSPGYLPAAVPQHLGRPLRRQGILERLAERVPLLQAPWPRPNRHRPAPGLHPADLAARVPPARSGRIMQRRSEWRERLTAPKAALRSQVASEGGVGTALMKSTEDRKEGLGVLARTSQPRTAAPWEALHTLPRRRMPIPA